MMLLQQLAVLLQQQAVLPQHQAQLPRKLAVLLQEQHADVMALPWELARKLAALQLE